MNRRHGRLGEAEHILLLTLHHIVADAWSARLVAEELLTLHAELSEGRAPSLPPLTATFAEGARALREKRAPKFPSAQD